MEVPPKLDVGAMAQAAGPPLQLGWMYPRGSRYSGYSLDRAVAGGWTNGPMARMPQRNTRGGDTGSGRANGTGALAEYGKGVGAGPAADDALLICANASISLRATRLMRQH